MKLETVLIETDSGAVVINKSDFDEKKHKLFKEKPVKKQTKKAK